jgi:hypothetical protein
VPKTGTGNLTPSEIADRCERWYGARVALDGAKYKIYPLDPAQRMVPLPDRLGNGTERSNILATLRKVGLDVLVEPASPERTPETVKTPTPADLATRTNGSAPNPSEAGEFDLVADEVDKLRALVTEIVEQVAELRAEFRTTVRDAAERMDALQQAIASGAGAPAKSRSQILRETVLAFFAAHRGVKCSPEMVKANIIDQIPEGMSGTAVAQACGELAKAGQLQGGAKGTARGPATTRGIYWLDPEPTE